MLKYICLCALWLSAYVEANSGNSKYTPFLHKGLMLRGGDISNQKESQTMYNKQASKWSRTKPNCLSDFTGRPVVFSMLEPHLQQASVLDVGCGEGYCARKVKEIGADSIIGCDISSEMIQCASSLAEQSQDQDSFHYFVSSSTSLLDGLEKERSTTNKIPKEFDVAMAVFLFNYLTTDEMTATMKQVYQALKSGGYFVFSVPHPSMIYCHDEDAIFRLESNGKGYFSSRNEKILGQISTMDGKKLNIMSVHKTLQDYFVAIQEAGFEIVDVKECSVTEEHMKMNPEFFTSVQDRPLHLVFKLRKK
ncbi:hypothetical protein CTEN210_09381 [Chaetoceros tenuissimus]|uniref:Methyltransferase domain-containing protein n=1 Tax=Chaetoceros tenuissimus TaxID=426638 RepID=A0AAD3CXQ3_9STRA|nr:hypothetical protein CTEN210_09381 [Chaetoceros tenuissimus]